jgi:chromosome segregation ATPase
MRVYELQKEINDFDYKMNQEGNKIKKHFDEQAKQLKAQNDAEFQRRYDEIEEMRNQQYALEDKKAQLNRQLENLLQLIFREKHEQEQHSETKEHVMQELKQQLTSLDALKTKVKALSNSQTTLREKILSLSIGNGMKQNDKETIMILLLQIVKELNGLKTHHRSHLVQNINQIENISQRQEVESILRSYKIIK